jgi:hypothetical protein
MLLDMTQRELSRITQFSPNDAVLKAMYRPPVTEERKSW